MHAMAHDFPAGLPASVATAVLGNTQFALDLYRTQRDAPGNVFFSPYSISTALAMTYGGARGETAAQMARVLHFDPDPEKLHPAFAALEARLADVGRQGRVQLRVANRLWPQQGYVFLEAYLALVQRFYAAPITPLDFRKPEAARQTINAWAEERTEGKIRDLIPPGILDALTSLVLANAIYFRGSWASRFDEAQTLQAPFWAAPGRQVQVQMMTQKGDFGYAEFDELQVLELLYAGGDLSMIVLLPRERGGLAALEEDLAAEQLSRWTARLWEQEVELFLPRFEVTYPARLDGALQSLGMVDAFSGLADFSGMDGSRELYIGAVLHKAFVVVNEEGTEAAAATAVIMARGMPAPPPVFRADHPFLFLIREKRTGSILLLGRLVEPLQKASEV
jgi:serpin B